VISVEGFLYSVTMIWAFPLFGWTAGQWGWLPAYGIAAGIVAALLLLFLVIDRRPRLRSAVTPVASG
jgi:hypothetical protein